jgi:hypothetical protein
MMLARCAGTFAAACLPAVLSIAAADAAAASPEMEACEYRAVYVDASVADDAARGREIAEPMRRVFLQMTTDAFSRRGLRIVQKPEDAYWILTASSLVGPTSVGVFIELTGSIELQHHLYIAELGRDGFPYRGEVGGNHYIDVLPATEPARYRGEIEYGVRLLWGLESEQVAALCAMSAKLRAEGWIGIKELRVELIEEMKRARRERATRTKQLDLQIDEPPPSGNSE